MRSESTVHASMQAITALGCMEHRGACSADNVSGDGAGVMTQIPWALIKESLPKTDQKTCGCAFDCMHAAGRIERDCSARLQHRSSP